MVKDGKAQTERPLSEAPSTGAEETPISTSGIVARVDAAADEARKVTAGKHRRRDSDPPSYRYLTPYQARLDVEMDDTAISKVRDPSVSIILDAEKTPLFRAFPLLRGSRREALLSTAVGVALGTLLVALIAAVVRACS